MVVERDRVNGGEKRGRNEKRHRRKREAERGRRKR